MRFLTEYEVVQHPQCAIEPHCHSHAVFLELIDALQRVSIHLRQRRCARRPLIWFDVRFEVRLRGLLRRINAVDVLWFQLKGVGAERLPDRLRVRDSVGNPAVGVGSRQAVNSYMVSVVRYYSTQESIKLSAIWSHLDQVVANLSEFRSSPLNLRETHQHNAMLKCMIRQQPTSSATSENVGGNNIRRGCLDFSSGFNCVSI